MSNNKKTENFYILQLCGSIIPLISTFIIATITYVTAKKAKDKKSEAMIPIMVIPTLFVSAGIISIVNYDLTKLVVAYILFTLCNFYLVKIQKNCNEFFLELPGNSVCKTSKSMSNTAIIVVCVLLVCASAVVLGINCLKNKPTFKQIEDSNGIDDYSLQTITMDDVLSETSSSSFMLSTNTHSGKTSGVSGRHSGSDYDEVSVSAKKFSGVHILQTTKSNSDKMSLTLKSTIVSGNFSAVILVDGMYYDNFEVNKNDEIELNNVKNKLITVKIAGESAECDVSVIRKNM